MSIHPELELVIGSRFDDLELVDVIMDFAGEYLAFSERERAKVAFAVREAAINAVCHGHRLEASAPVTITIRLERELLTVRVRDDGAGFDPSALPDPVAAANLLKPAGRGIFLMRRLMDEVRFHFPPEGGTVVEMLRHVSRASVAAPEQAGH